MGKNLEKNLKNLEDLYTLISIPYKATVNIVSRRKIEISVDTHIHNQLTSIQGAKSTKWEKEGYLIKWCWGN